MKTHQRGSTMQRGEAPHEKEQKNAAELAKGFCPFRKM